MNPIPAHPATPCCDYEANLEDSYPVLWNPINKVVQCHNCGHVYTPQSPQNATGSARAQTEEYNPEDPHGLPQHVPGAKNDNGKAYASLLLNFPRALKAVAEVATYGARKYTRDGWESVPDGITRYRDAEWRHMLDGKLEMCDQESGLPHAWHRAWNVLAVLELELRKEEAELRQLNEPCAT